MTKIHVSAPCNTAKFTELCKNHTIILDTSFCMHRDFPQFMQNSLIPTLRLCNGKMLIPSAVYEELTHLKSKVGSVAAERREQLHELEAQSLAERVGENRVADREILKNACGREGSLLALTQDELLAKDLQYIGKEKLLVACLDKNGELCLYSSSKKEV